MKATALIAAAALAFGGAAFAQQHDDTKARTDDTRAEHSEHGNANQKMRNGAHRLAEKTRNAMHRLGDKLHARRDHADDTRAMGASGTDSSRQQRMDEAYSHWQARDQRADDRADDRIERKAEHKAHRVERKADRNAEHAAR